MGIHLIVSASPWEKDEEYQKIRINRKLDKSQCTWTRERDRAIRMCGRERKWWKYEMWKHNSILLITYRHMQTDSCLFIYSAHWASTFIFIVCAFIQHWLIEVAETVFSCCWPDFVLFDSTLNRMQQQQRNERGEPPNDFMSKSVSHNLIIKKLLKRIATLRLNEWFNAIHHRECSQPYIYTIKCIVSVNTNDIRCQAIVKPLIADMRWNSVTFSFYSFRLFWFYVHRSWFIH